MGVLHPVRKVYYNLAITGLSVSICFFIGTIEILGLLPTELGGLHGGFWHFMEAFDINRAGFVIVGMFVVTWAGALLLWKYGHVEERWSADVRDGSERPLGQATTSIPARTPGARARRASSVSNGRSRRSARAM